MVIFTGTAYLMPREQFDQLGITVPEKLEGQFSRVATQRDFEVVWQGQGEPVFTAESVKEIRDKDTGKVVSRHVVKSHSGRRRVRFRD